MAPAPPIAVSSIHEPSTIWTRQVDSPSTIIPPLPRGPSIVAATAKANDENRIRDHSLKSANVVVTPPAIVPLPIQTKPEEPQTLPTISPRNSSHIQPCHIDHSIEITVHDHPTSEEPRRVQSLNVDGGSEVVSVPVIRVFPPSHRSARSSSLPRRAAASTQAPEMWHDTAHQPELGTSFVSTGPLPSSHQERSSRPRVLKPLTTAKSQTKNDQSRYPSHTVSYEPLVPPVNYLQMPDSYRPQSNRSGHRSQWPAGVDENVTPKDSATIPRVSLSPKLRRNASYGQTERRSHPRMARFGSQSLLPESPHTKRARFSSPPTMVYSDGQRSGNDLPSWQPEPDIHVHSGHYAQHHLPVW
jgi:hypothetical protein